MDEGEGEGANRGLLLRVKARQKQGHVSISSGLFLVPATGEVSKKRDRIAEKLGYRGEIEFGIEFGIECTAESPDLQSTGSAH